MRTTRKIAGEENLDTPKFNDLNSNTRINKLQNTIKTMAELPTILFSTDMPTPSRLDQILNQAIALVGQTLCVSRVYIMQDEDNGRFLRNTHEWVNETSGHAMASWPLHDYKKDVPSLKPLLAENPVLAAHTRLLPPDLQATFEKQGVASILITPLLRDNRWLGLIGMDCCNGERDWQEEEVCLLTCLARLIAQTFERNDYFLAKRKLDSIRHSLNDDSLIPLASQPTGGDQGTAGKNGLTLLEAEKRLIIDTLARNRGNRGAAARQLGIAWAALDRRCKKLNIKVTRSSSLNE